MVGKLPLSCFPKGSRISAISLKAGWRKTSTSGYAGSLSLVKLSWIPRQVSIWMVFPIPAIIWTLKPFVLQSQFG